MAKMIQSHLKLLPGGGEEIIKQKTKQFPPDEKARQEKYMPDMRALERITQVIVGATEGEIMLDRDHNLIINERCQKALQEFRDALEPKGVITKGKHFNAALLLKAFNIYVSLKEEFYESPAKCALFWRQIIGYIHRFVPARYADQAYYTDQPGNRNERMYRKDFAPGVVSFPLDTDPDFRLGYDYAGADMIDCATFVVEVAAKDFAKLMSQKNRQLAEFYENPTTSRKPGF